MENMAHENPEVDDEVIVELLLKEITELVIDQGLLSGKALKEDRVTNFVHPEKLKVIWLNEYDRCECFMLCFLSTEVGRSIAR